MSEPFFLDTIEARNHLSERIRELPVDDKHSWEVVIRRKRESRTNKQLRLYWKWTRLIGVRQGMSPEQVDLALRRKYAPVEVIFDGEAVILPGDVSGFDVEQYGEYLDWVHMTAWQEFAIELPLPPKPDQEKKAA